MQFDESLWFEEEAVVAVDDDEKVEPEVEGFEFAIEAAPTLAVFSRNLLFRECF